MGEKKRGGRSLARRRLDPKKMLIGMMGVEETSLR